MNKELFRLSWAAGIQYDYLGIPVIDKREMLSEFCKLILDEVELTDPSTSETIKKMKVKFGI